MKNKKSKTKRSLFCKCVNKLFAEKLRQALCAEEVTFNNNEFIIITGYDVTESYYGHQLIQPIGSKISLLEGLYTIINHMKNKEVPVVYYPKYSEVFSTLSSKEIHRCFIAYEVLCMDTSSFIKDMANRYLMHIASAHHWDFNTFMYIIEEEYNCSYNK